MPTNFIADLRYPIEDKEHREDKWSLWSSLPMIELSALDTYQFVKAMILRPAQKILEIGCGNGYLSLELARDGHKVIGLDRSNDIIEVAERTRAAHSDTPGFGKLTYICTDFDIWQGTDASFDLVVINRTLHHLTDLRPMIAKVKRLLTPQGHIICQDYAYDRLNDQTASWMYAMRLLLFLSRLADEDPATTDDAELSIEAGRKAWFKRAEEHHLNRFEKMSLTLRTAFREQVFAWVPYLFVYIGNRIQHATPEQERALITFLVIAGEILSRFGGVLSQWLSHAQENDVPLKRKKCSFLSLSKKQSFRSYVGVNMLAVHQIEQHLSLGSHMLQKKVSPRMCYACCEVSGVSQ